MILCPELFAAFAIFAIFAIFANFAAGRLGRGGELAGGVECHSDCDIQPGVLPC
jgi:hypothetical protein